MSVCVCVCRLVVLYLCVFKGGNVIQVIIFGAGVQQIKWLSHQQYGVDFKVCVCVCETHFSTLQV